MSANAQAQELEAGTEPSFVGPLYHFTSRLFTVLIAEADKSNIIVSPISIHKALNLALLGTDGNSATERELRQAIGYAGLSEAEIKACHEDYARVLAKFKAISSETLAKIKQNAAEAADKADDKRMFGVGSSAPRTPVLDVFNMVITKNKGQVMPSYSDDISRYFESSIETVDDTRPETKRELAERLNSWAKEAGFDSAIMREADLSASFAAILISAIRVHAYWLDEFSESPRGGGAFYNHGLREAQVHAPILLNRELRSARYLEFGAAETGSAASDHLGELEFRAVQVPLLGDLDFTIFEPLEFSTPGDNKLSKLVHALLAKSQGGDEPAISLLAVLQLLEGERQGCGGPLYLTLPKFKFEQELGLVDALKSMGLQRVFCDGPESEICAMMSERVYISDVRHQAVIDVNQQGIKAAGVTRVTMMFAESLDASRPRRVAIERPFMFLIRHEKIPLFVGQLTSL